MFYLVHYGILHLEIVTPIFSLDSGDGRGFLTKHLKYLIDTRGDLKEAASITRTLNLQEYISPTEILLPLIAGDKLQVIDAYLKDNAKQQRAYVEMLSQLCSMNEATLLKYIQRYYYNKQKLKFLY